MGRLRRTVLVRHRVRISSLIERPLAIGTQGKPRRSAIAAFPSILVARLVGRRLRVDLAIVLLGSMAATLLLGPLEALLATLWWIAAIVVIRSDLERFIIPDAASAVIAALGLSQALSAALSEGADRPATLEAALDAVSRGAVVFAAFWLVACLYRWRAGRDGLGFGDVKLAAASAVWLDFNQQAAALEIACLSAIALVVVRRRGPDERRAAVPFGAFLAPSAWLVFGADPVLGAVLRNLT